MNNPTPPRAPELQASLDWHLPMDQYNMLPFERKDAATQAWHNGDSELIIAAEVYRLEEQVRTLRTACEPLVHVAKLTERHRDEIGLWHQSDSHGPSFTLTMGDVRKIAALAQPSETKGTK